jgi:hypothetical protein
MERKKLQQTIELLKKEIQTLREELIMFQKDKYEKQNISRKVQIMKYHTDEEQLSRETEWILKKNKRLTGNVTTEGGRDGTNPTIERAEKVRPPPIIVGNNQNYQEMYNYVQKTTILISKHF